MAYTSGSDSHGGMVDVMVGGCNGDVDGEGTELYDRVSRSSKRKSGDVYIWWSFFYVNKHLFLPDRVRWIAAVGSLSVFPSPFFPPVITMEEDRSTHNNPIVTGISPGFTARK